MDERRGPAADYRGEDPLQQVSRAKPLTDWVGPRELVFYCNNLLLPYVSTIG